MKKVIINSPADFLIIAAKTGKLPKKSERVYSEKYKEFMKSIRGQINDSKKETGELKKEYYRDATKQLKNSYVRKTLIDSGEFRPEDLDINPEIIELKRTIIKTKRLCNKQSQQM